MKKLNARQLGARIKAARHAAGLTQSRLAELAGIEVQSLSRIERGAYEPSLSTTVTLARALGQSLDRLVLGEPGEALADWRITPSEAREGLLLALQQFERSIDALPLSDAGGPLRVENLRRRVAKNVKDR